MVEAVANAVEPGIVARVTVQAGEKLVVVLVRHPVSSVTSRRRLWEVKTTVMT